MSFEDALKTHAESYDGTPAEEKPIASGEYQFELVELDFGTYSNEKTNNEDCPRILATWRFRAGDNADKTITTFSSFVSEGAISIFKRSFLKPIGIDPLTPLAELSNVMISLIGTYVVAKYKSTEKKTGDGFYHNIYVSSVEGKNENSPEY